MLIKFQHIICIVPEINVASSLWKQILKIVMYRLGTQAEVFVDLETEQNRFLNYEESFLNNGIFYKGI